MAGDSLPIEIAADAHVLALKFEISERHPEFPARRQRLVVMREEADDPETAWLVLENKHTLVECVQDGAEINLIIADAATTQTTDKVRGWLQAQRRIESFVTSSPPI